MIDAFDRWLLRNFDESGRAHAAQLTGRAVRSVLGICTLTGTVVFIGVTFRHIVAPSLLVPWLAAMAIVIAAPFMLIIAFAVHGPGTEAAIRPYMIIARVTTFSLSMLIAASVWILLPHASLPLQCLMLILYVTFVAMVLGADAHPALMIEQLGVMASAIAFVLVYRLPFAVPLAIVLGAVAISLVGLHRLTYRSTAAAIAARAETERAIAALKIALADVATQRDAKTRFISAASHDLRQPVQAAALYFEHALSETTPPLRERAIAGARRALTSVDALLETMLDHLRFEAGAATARLAPVALATVFAEVIGQLTPSARAANIQLTVVPSSKWVVADTAMLQRVLINVVGNAIRHSAGQRVLIGARRSGDIVIIWIIDDGRGIRTADVTRLFEDYVQGSGEGAVPGGFGIGLSSSRRMVDLMHGEITLDRRWVRGAAFRLQLPAARVTVEERVWKAA
ncbi:sensor histidine kinase [Sphingomonas sp. 28-63-12]|uniref:sensor histidine kinase n=1 Tax=Sphingomonas sp. 28-63-12 TaxID=1970434 RepID=UPI0035A963BD